MYTSKRQHQSHLQTPIADLLLEKLQKGNITKAEKSFIVRNVHNAIETKPQTVKPIL